MLLASAVAVSHGLTIDCLFSNMNAQTSPTMSYTCQATITVDGNPDITAVTGTHSQGMTNANVGGFYLSNGYMLKVDKIPSNLATYFPNLVQISWDNSRLKTLTAADLAPFPNLFLISANMNMLRQLDGDLFKNNPYLRYAYFQYNTIELIGPEIFDGLNYLTDLQFYGNRCVQYTMMMQIYQGYTIQDFKDDLIFLCGPDGSSSSPIDGSCPANCSATLSVLEAEIAEVELDFNEGCWTRLMKTLAVWFNL